jgi:hypothetical protein
MLIKPCETIRIQQLTLVLVGWLTLSASLGAVEPTGVARSLADYANDDGRAPDGRDSKRDDTSAFRKALAAGPGVVRLGPGYFRLGEVTIPSHVAVVGAGKSTVIRRSDGAKRVFVQSKTNGWALRDLVLDGESTGDWQGRKDLGEHGIFIEHCWGYDIVSVTVRQFQGAGLQITRTNLVEAGFGAGGNLDRIEASGCAVGVRFDVRAEYLNATKLSCHHNVVGCVIHAGNVKVAASNIGNNVDGLVIVDKENGSHGAISNCLVNHNTRHALLARGVENGMAIDNCCFFFGEIRLENCKGINLTDGILGCSLRIDGDKYNRVAGNYVIPANWTFTLAPTTLIQGNFTEAGPWDKNSR